MGKGQGRKGEVLREGRGRQAGAYGIRRRAGLPPRILCPTAIYVSDGKIDISFNNLNMFLSLSVSKMMKDVYSRKHTISMHSSEQTIELPYIKLKIQIQYSIIAV